MPIECFHIDGMMKSITWDAFTTPSRDINPRVFSSDWTCTSGKLLHVAMENDHFYEVNHRFLCAIYTMANCIKLPEGNGRRDINNGII